MKQTVLSFLAGSLITFFVMKSFSPLQEIQFSKSKEQLQLINDKIKSFSENEYQDYLNLKDSVEKYKKADELLGKVMVLFLADLSLSLKKSEPLVDVKASADTSKSEPSTATSSTNKDEIVMSPSTIQNQSTSVLESKLLASQNQNEALKILKELELKDIATEIKNTKTLTADQLKLVSGKYVGVVTFDDKTEPWRIEWDLDGKIENGQVVGEQLITLSNSKKVFSRSLGKGSIKDFASFGEDTSAILINSYGDDGYIQLYPFANTGKIFGNYYLKDKNDKFKKIGIVFLEKVN